MKKLWGIRHVRFFFLSWLVHRWARQWGQIGVGLGVPNEHDLRVLQLIWDGKQ